MTTETESESESDICLLVKDRRVKTCPIANKIAKNAAEKTAKEVFKQFGYDLDKTEDVKKLTILFDFLETLSNNVKRGKIIVGSTVLKVVVTAIIGTSAFTWVTKNGGTQ